MSPALVSSINPIAAPTTDSASVPERILAAALELLQTQGLQALSQARVAAAAGLRQSHLTYYFPTRKDLLKAIVESIIQGLVASFSIDAPSVERMRDYFARRMHDPLLARLMLTLMAATDEDPSLGDWLANFDHEVISCWQSALAQLDLFPNEQDLAWFHATIVGAAILAARQGNPEAAARSERIACMAFDHLIQAARQPACPNSTEIKS